MIMKATFSSSIADVYSTISCGRYHGNFADTPTKHKI